MEHNILAHYYQIYQCRSTWLVFSVFYLYIVICLYETLINYSFMNKLTFSLGSQKSQVELSNQTIWNICTYTCRLSPWLRVVRVNDCHADTFWGFIAKLFHLLNKLIKTKTIKSPDSQILTTQYAQYVTSVTLVCRQANSREKYRRLWGSVPKN